MATVQNAWKSQPKKAVAVTLECDNMLDTFPDQARYDRQYSDLLAHVTHFSRQRAAGTQSIIQYYRFDWQS